MTVKPLPTVGTRPMNAPRGMDTPAPMAKPLKTVAALTPTPRLPGLQQAPAKSLVDLAHEMHPHPPSRR